MSAAAYAVCDVNFCPSGDLWHCNIERLSWKGMVRTEDSGSGVIRRGALRMRRGEFALLIASLSHKMVGVKDCFFRWPRIWKKSALTCGLAPSRDNTGASPELGENLPALILARGQSARRILPFLLSVHRHPTRLKHIDENEWQGSCNTVRAAVRATFGIADEMTWRSSSRTRDDNLCNNSRNSTNSRVPFPSRSISETKSSRSWSGTSTPLLVYAHFRR